MSGFRFEATGKPHIEIDIEKLVYGGDGLGRHDGQVVLVPFVLPGERVSTATAQVKSGLLRGSGPKILQQSPERIVPHCEYFGRCGGCQYQHAEYAFQLKQKQAILRETLQRLGGFRYDERIAVVSGPPWNYRNRVQLHFADRALGFHRAGSHELCAIDHCPISSPLLNQVIEKLTWAIERPEWPRFLRSLELFTNESEVQLHIVDSTRPVANRFFEWCGSFVPGFVPGAIEYSAAGHRFRISRGSFFQVNRFLIDALVEEVLCNSAGDHALDLYAGVGLFSVPLAGRFKRVDAVERSAPPFRDLEFNIQRATANVRTAKSDSELFLQAIETRPDLVVADPPRTGLGTKVTNELLRIAPSKITLVSCDPSTLARDLQKLSARYRVTRLALLDLFPQTYHFEVVTHLALP